MIRHGWCVYCIWFSLWIVLDLDRAVERRGERLEPLQLIQDPVEVG